MKRTIALISVLILAVCLFAGCSVNGEDATPVMSVSLITGSGTMGAVSSYAGVVVSGETAYVEKDADKNVLELYVAEGDQVEEGDILFTYDTEAMQLSLDKLYLEKESYENDITAAQNEIATLEKEKASASSDQQLSYTLQISSLEANIREDEYDLSLKEREIASMESSMDQTEITAPLSGRVMSVSEDDYSSDAYITIMDVSSYRVQGYINELNLYDLSEGTDVVIRSRVDDSLWYGTISSIDWEGSTLTTTDSYYYTDSMSSSSKYPFYIEVDDTAGLLLGQHVYIEPDYGQYRDTDALMLPAYYIVDSDNDPYVWAASSKGKLEKRPVTLGTYDADLDTYEILTGLTLDDYIAFPEEDLAEGQSVTYYDESSFGTDEDAYYDDYEFYEDDYYDEYFDDYLYDEDYYYDDDYLYEDDFYYDDDYSYEGFDLEDEDIYYEDDYSYEEDDLYYGDEGDIADPYDGGELVTDQQIEDPVLLVEGG